MSKSQLVIELKDLNVKEMFSIYCILTKDGKTLTIEQATKLNNSLDRFVVNIENRFALIDSKKAKQFHLMKQQCCNILGIKYRENDYSYEILMTGLLTDLQKVSEYPDEKYKAMLQHYLIIEQDIIATLRQKK